MKTTKKEQGFSIIGSNPSIYCTICKWVVVIIGVCVIFQCKNQRNVNTYQFVLKPTTSLDKYPFYVDRVVYSYTEYKDSMNVQRTIIFNTGKQIKTEYSLYRTVDTIYLGTIDGYSKHIKEPYLIKKKGQTVQYVSFNGNSTSLGGSTTYQKDTIAHYYKRPMKLSKYFGREVAFNSAMDVPFFVDSKGRTIKISCFELQSIHCNESNR
ncbi:MAG: hypothetical protein Q8861_04155 [Bacteroidota bacterium]|nr:hypothetical protein [Bacteroidota bacterium]MDP4272177.1 hypothetical protein [Bacteroidota bacterium]